MVSSDLNSARSEYLLARAKNGGRRESDDSSECLTHIYFYICMSESDCDTGMCDCSSLKSIMQTLDLI